MRLATALLVLVSFALMVGAAYLPSGWWQVALFADVVAWTISLFALLSAGLQHFAKASAAWAHASVALFAAALALAQSFAARPGELTGYPFRELQRNAVSLAGLGCVIAGATLALIVIKLGARGPSRLAALALAICLIAARGWIHLP